MRRALLAALAVTAVAVSAGADTVLTVGPGGTHTTIQGAIDTAVSGSGAFEIRVATGLWRERLRVVLEEGHGITLTGGWLADFSARTDDPSRPTIIDAGSTGTVVTIHTTGYVAVTGFVITGGLAPSSGGGVFINARRFGDVHLFGNVIRSNRVVSPEAVDGGGLVAGAWDGGYLSIRDNLFERNAAVSSAAMAERGGANVFGTDASYLEVVDNRFFDNEVRAPEVAMVSALAVGVSGSAVGYVDRNIMRNNRASTGRVGGGFSAFRLFASTGADGERPQLFARQNQVLGNPTDDAGQQVELHAFGKGTILALTDSVVARGNGGAITTNVGDGGALYLTNLTVTGHPSYGIFSFGSAPYVSNTILFDDGTAIDGPALESHNLKDVDPLFLSPGADNYRLDFGSPAIDRGDNRAAFLGTLDVYGGPRIENGVVDIGADEAPASFGHGEPPCLILPSGIVLDRSVPACRCFSDRTLLETHCGFFLPGLFLDMELPFPLPPGDPVPVNWTIHPWMSVAGPYRMQAEARIDGKWVPQAWLGPTAKELKEGQLVVEPFRLQPAAKGLTPFRTTLRYLLPGQKTPTSVGLEVLLPAPEGKQ
jgi:hypothetical protein